MKPDIAPPSESEPAVRSPELQALVEAARNVPPVTVSVEATAIHAGWARRRAARRRNVATGVLAAAGLAALFFTRQAPTAEAVEPAQVATASPAAPAIETVNPPVAVAEALAADISVVRRGQDTPAPTVLAARELRVERGEYEIAIPEASDPVVVRLLDGHVQLETGVILVIFGVGSAEVEAIEGRAVWTHADGTVTTLTPVPDEDRAGKDRGKSSARALARRAEDLMRSGDRDRAITLFQRIVREHPRSTAARAAALDLGRLLGAAGRKHEARCAYLVFLERWPYSQLRGDVEKALARLGSDATCKSLDPR